MREKIIVAPGFFAYCLPVWVSGITLYPFILLRSEHLRENSVLLNHERIHLRQQRDMLIVLFYLWYGIEYLIRFFQTGSRFEAYKRLSFEREAYACEGMENYLSHRKLWSHLRWI